ncbi:MAG: hypothetical protein ACYSUK_03915 [Planctomycetota bacterium]
MIFLYSNLTHPWDANHSINPQKQEWAGLDSNQRKLTLTGYISEYSLRFLKKLDIEAIKRGD